MIVLTVLSPESSSAISKKEDQINYGKWDEYKSSKKGMATLYLNVENKINLHMSNVIFGLVTCKSARTNLAEYCKNERKCKVYKRFNIYNSIKCSKEINLSEEIEKTLPLWYHFF